MLHLKHDIKIEIKNEKEVFRLVRLLIFTFLFSAIFLGLPDYIWNITWYLISGCLVPWVVAIPAIIYCLRQKINWRKLFGKRIGFQILVGTGIGTLIAVLWIGIEYLIQDGTVAQLYTKNMSKVLYVLCFYLFMVGPSEELIYRVAIMGSFEKLLNRHRWLAPLIANTLFALSHLFQNDWRNVGLAFGIGGIYTLMYYKWEKCGYIMVSVIHGMFDFMVVFLPFVWNRF